MNARQWIPSVLLVASAALNIKFLTDEKAGPAVTIQAATRLGGAPSGGPAHATDTVPGAVGPVAVARDVAAGRTSSPTQLAACLGALAQTQKELRQALPLPEHFKRGAPAPELEAAFDKEMRRALAGIDGGKPEVAVECRDRTCRIEMMAPSEGPILVAQEVLQQSKEFSQKFHVDSAMFTGTRPTTDPFTHQALQRTEVFMELAPEGAVDGDEIVEALAAQWVKSSAAADCFRQFPEKGELAVAISVQQDQGLAFEAGGSLGAGRAGACLLEHLQALGSQLTLPELITHGSTEAVVTLPPR